MNLVPGMMTVVVMMMLVFMFGMAGMFQAILTRATVTAMMRMITMIVFILGRIQIIAKP